MFTINALLWTSLVFPAANFVLGGAFGELDPVIAAYISIVFFMTFLAPLYLDDIFPDPVKVLRDFARSIHKIAAATLIVGLINFVIALFSALPMEIALAKILAATGQGQADLKPEHMFLVSDAPALFIIQMLLFLHFLAAAFIAARFGDVAYGEDLRGIAETF